MATSCQVSYITALPFRMTGWGRQGIVRRTLLQDSTQCLLNLEAFLHTLGDSRSAAGMTAKPAQPRLAFSANLRLTFPCIPLSTSRRFLKTFYYFSLHDQIASYRASLRHGAIGLGSLHFSLDAVHGAERFSGCAFGYANCLQ